MKLLLVKRDFQIIDREYLENLQNKSQLSSEFYIFSSTIYLNLHPSILKINAELRLMGSQSFITASNYELIDGLVISLDLRDITLPDEVPSSVFHLRDLAILRLGQVSRISDEIINLKNLRLLELSQYMNEMINETICELKNLETLIIKRSNITQLPESHDTLENLRDIDLINNDISYFPKVLRKIKSLRYLSIAGFYDLPEMMGEKLIKLSQLEKLFIAKMKHDVFPQLWEYITELTNLTSLTISGFESEDLSLTTIPPTINNLKKLESLWVEGKIQCMPDIPDLVNLKELYLFATPLNGRENEILLSKKGICLLSECELHNSKDSPLPLQGK